MRTALTALEELRLPRPAAVGHRLVHGGPDHTAPERLTPALLQTLRRLIPLAPLHLPGELQVIKVVTDRHPDLPQVVCFDTAFHRRMPELAQRLPLPRALWDRGGAAYGFHGLSYEYILDHLGVAAASGRLIIAHLGNGASMAAVRDGRPLDTTMGFTPMGGFMMETRSGDLDPGVLIYLLTAKRYDTERLERLVMLCRLLVPFGIAADPTVWDGRYANNGFLQELQKPLTKLTWDNAPLVSVATAQRLGLANEDVVQLRFHGRSLRAPVWIMPGHADNAVTVHLGYGRRRAGPRYHRGLGAIIPLHPFAALAP